MLRRWTAVREDTGDYGGEVIVEGPGKRQAGTRGCPFARRRTKGPTSGGRNQGTEGLRVVYVVARFLGSKA